MVSVDTHPTVSVDTHRRVVPALILTGLVSAGPAAAGQGPVIVASIFPLAAIAQEIAEPGAEVVTVLPAGGNPHTFEPAPSQVWAAARADLVLRIGVGFDDWVLRVVEAVRGQPIVLIASEGVDLLPLDAATHVAPHGAQHGETVWDPHIWIDPAVAAAIGERVAAALARFDPARLAAYRERAGRFRAAMVALDAEVRGRLKPFAGSGFVGTHAGWAYFARRYGLRQIAVLERAPGRPAGPRYLLRVAREARAAGARAVFAEVQLPQGEARILAEETHLPVVVLDPLGGPNLPDRSRYAEWLRWNVRRMAAALAGKPVAS
jgi:ABC-type Zn uptake system ZnuABC Zn-binding protein ZnuA